MTEATVGIIEGEETIIDMEIEIILTETQEILEIIETIEEGAETILMKKMMKNLISIGKETEEVIGTY